MQAFWRAKAIGSEETHYSLWTLIEGRPRKIKTLRGYACWNNPRAEAEAARIERAIEGEAAAAGYAIIANPID